MGALSSLGVREFEPKCADPVSDDFLSITRLLHGKSSYFLPYNWLNDAEL